MSTPCWLTAERVGVGVGGRRCLRLLSLNRGGVLGLWWVRRQQPGSASVTMGTAQGSFPDRSSLIGGLCGESALNASCPSWKQLYSQVKPGRVHRGRGLSEEQAGQANPRYETTSKRCSKRTKTETLRHTILGSAHFCHIHNSAVHHRHSSLRMTASARHRHHGDACLDTCLVLFLSQEINQ